MWKTVSARIRGATTELEEMGEETDGLAEGLSKYRKEIMALTGVDIMKNEKEYKNVYDIFVELANVWDKINGDEAKARVAEILGGTRQLSGVMSTITNIGDAIHAAEDSVGDLDVAINANNQYMDTATAKVGQFKASFEELAVDLFDSSFVKSVIDVGRGIVEVLDMLVDSFGVFGAAIPIASVAAFSFQLVKLGEAAKGATIIQKLGMAFSSLAQSLGLTAGVLGPIAGIIGVVGAIGVGVQMYNRHMEDLRSSTMESANAFESQRSNMDAQIAKYKELSERLHNSSITEEESRNIKQQLIEMQRSLIDTYGEQASGIDLVNGKLDEEIAKMQALSEYDANKFLNDPDNIKQIEKARKILSEPLGGKDGTVLGILTSYDGADYAKESAEIDSIIDKYSEYIEVVEDATTGNREIRFVGTAEEGQTVLQNLATDLRNAKEEFEHPVNLEKLFIGADAASADADNVIEKWQEIYDMAQRAELVADKGLYQIAESGDYGGIQKSALEWIKEYTDAVDEYNNKLLEFSASGSTDGLQEASDKYHNLNSLIVDATTPGGALSSYKGAFDEVRDSINQAAEAEHELVEQQSLYKNQFSSVDDFMDRWRDGASGMDEIVEKARKLGMISGDTYADVYDLAMTLEKLGVISAVASDDVSGAVKSIEELKRGIEGAVEYEKLMSEAMSDSTSATGLTTEEIEKLGEAYQGLESYDPSTLFETTTNGIHLNRDALDALNDEIRNSRLDELYDKLYALQSMGADADSINEVKQLIAQYEGLTSAYNRWVEAQSGGNERDSYESLANGYEEMKKLLDQGWRGDASLNKYLDLMLGDRRSGDAYKDFLKIDKNIKGLSHSLSDYFVFDEDSGDLVVDGLIDFMKDVNKKLGKEFLDLDKKTFDFSGDKLQQVADAFGTTTEVVQIFERALIDAGVDVKLENVSRAIDDVKKSTKGLKGVDIDLDFNLDEMSADDIQNKVDELNTAKAKINVDTTEGEAAVKKIDALIEALNYKKVQVSISAQIEGGKSIEELTNMSDEDLQKTLKINTDEVEEARRQLELLANDEVSADLTVKIDESQFSQLTATDKSVSVSVDVVGQDQLNTLKETIDSIESKTVEVRANVHGLKGHNSITELTDAIRNLTGKVVNIVANVIGINNVERLSSAIRGANSKTIRVNTIRNTVIKRELYGKGTMYASPSKAYANGRVSLDKSETALVNELGTESLIRDGKWMLIPGGMHMENLEKGDIILSAAQTKALIKNGAAPGHGKAYASGTLSNAYDEGNFGNLGRVKKTKTKTAKEKYKEDSKSKSKSKKKKSKTDSKTSKAADKVSKVADKESTALDKFQEWLGKFFDWIEVKVERISSRIDKFLARAEIATTRGNYDTASKNYRKALNDTYRLMDTQSKASSKYQNFANKVLAKAVSLGVINKSQVQSIKANVANGTIDIREYSEKVRDVISEYKSWVDKSKEASNAIQDLTTNVNSYIESLKSLRDTQRDARIEAIENLTSIGTGGIVSEYSTGLSNSQLSYSSSQTRRKNAAYGAATHAVGTDLTAIGKTATSSVKSAMKGASKAYKNVLKRIKTNIAKKIEISSKDLTAVKKRSVVLYNRLVAYNMALDNLEVARMEQALNYSEASAEIYNNTMQAYENRDKMYENNISKYNSLADTASSAAKKNSYLDQVASQYDLINTNNTNEILDYNKSIRNAGKIIGKGRSKLVGAAYHGLGSGGKNSVMKTIEEVKSLVKNRKPIPASKLARLAELYSKGYITYQFYSACVNYNNALQLRDQARAQAEIDKQTAIEQKAAIGEQKFSNVQQEYSNQQSIINDAGDMLSARQDLKTTRGLSLNSGDYKALIKNNKELIESYGEEISKLNAIIESNISNGYWTENSQEYLDALSQVRQYETDIINLTKTQEEYNNALAELPYNTIEEALELLDAMQSNYEAQMDYMRESGKDLSESDYLKQIEYNNRQLEKYEAERAQAYEDMLKAMSSDDGVYGGKTADQWKQIYYDLGTSIIDIKSEILDIQDELRDDVYWRTFERAHDSAERLLDIVSGISNLIDDDMLFNKDGNLTDFGISQLSNLVKQYEIARQEVGNYSNDIANLNNLYAEGMYTSEEYNEKLADLQNELLDSASDMKGYLDEIKDMYKDMAQAELDSLLELIDARSEALNSKRDYYEYDKTIKEKTRDIQTLEAQLAALEGITTAEAKAKRAQLTASLAEAREDLEETQRSHYFDLSQDGLNQLKATLQDEFDDKWNYLGQNLESMKQLLENANNLTASSTSTVVEAINSLLEFYGINPADINVDGAYAKGKKRFTGHLVGLSNESGSEIIVTDNGIISRFKPGDGVVPGDLTERLYQLAELIKPGYALGNVDKASLKFGGSLRDAEITQNYDSLIHIEGSADAATVEDLKNMTSDLLKKSYEYTSDRIYKGYMRSGGRRAV